MKNLQKALKGIGLAALIALTPRISNAVPIPSTSNDEEAALYELYDIVNSTEPSARNRTDDSDTENEGDLISNHFEKQGIQLETKFGRPVSNSSGYNESYFSENDFFDTRHYKETAKQENYRLFMKTKALEKGFLTFEMSKAFIDKSMSSKNEYSSEYSPETRSREEEEFRDESSGRDYENLESIMLSVIPLEDIVIEIGAGPAYLSKKGRNSGSSERFSHVIYKTEDDTDPIYHVIIKDYDSEFQGMNSLDCRGFKLMFNKGGSILPFEISSACLEGNKTDFCETAYSQYESESTYDKNNNRLSREINTYEGKYTDAANYTVKIRDAEIKFPLSYRGVSTILSHKQTLEEISKLGSDIFQKNLAATYEIEVRYKSGPVIIGADYSCTNRSEKILSGGHLSKTRRTYDNFGIILGCEFGGKSK